jgi:hypothetical protein
VAFAFVPVSSKYQPTGSVDDNPLADRLSKFSADAALMAVRFTAPVPTANRRIAAAADAMSTRAIRRDLRIIDDPIEQKVSVTGRPGRDSALRECAREAVSAIDVTEQ